MNEVCLADLINTPGYRLEEKRLTMDFSKPVVTDALKSSFSGGNTDNQIIMYVN